MIPDPLPEDIRADDLRTAECKVYDRLNEVLDDSFTVFYSRPWLGIERDGSEIDGECDFVIAHPDLGFLVVEVKGGGIEYRSETNEWFSTDRWNFKHNIKDPVKQAREGKYRILDRLKKSGRYLPEWIEAYHCVIFPDSKKVEYNLGIDKPHMIFCFRDDFVGDLKRWILSRFNTAKKTDRRQRALGIAGMNALHDLLAKPFQCHAPLISYLSEDDRSIALLTQEQYRTLTEIEDISRVIIRGGAGTGKTVLAIEEAIRRARMGLRVLLTCYNKPLATHLAKRVESEPRIKVQTFHSLCVKAIEEANLLVPEDIDEDTKFRKTYPELFVQSLQILEDLRFDVIIVDEGQDFLPFWIRSLDAALDPDGKKFFRIFYDSNQNIYTDYTSLDSGFQPSPIKLTRNLRNTRKIHSLVETFYTGCLLEGRGPLGQDIEYVPAESSNEIREKLVEVILNLVQNENVEPSDITVLTESKRQLEAYVLKGKIAGYLCQNSELSVENAIVFDTVRRFKGLENRIVIVVLSDPMFLDEELLYIAFSRPRTHLIIIGSLSLLKMLQDRNKMA